MQPFRAPRQQKEKASLTRQSPRRQGKQELGHVWKPVVIKETQFDNIEEVIDCSLVEAATHPAIGATAASPSCSEFEAFLDSKSVSANASAASVSVGGSKKISKTDAYWNNVLELEKQRLAANAVDSFVPVDAIMFDISSDDDDVPIVATLTANKTNLSLLVDVATQPVSSPTIRKKSQTKVVPHHDSAPAIIKKS
jgi:hypothetical protein